MKDTITFKQMAFCVGYGLALWMGAIFLVRAMAGMGALSGVGLIIAFIVLIPATIPAVLLTQRVMGPSKAQLLVGVSIISAIALLLAGLSFSFSPSFYGTHPALVISAAGFILWGGGIGLVLALLMGKDR
jgi:hypothetical protein